VGMGKATGKRVSQWCGPLRSFLALISKVQNKTGHQKGAKCGRRGSERLVIPPCRPSAIEVARTEYYTTFTENVTMTRANLGQRQSKGWNETPPSSSSMMIDSRIVLRCYHRTGTSTVRVKVEVYRYRYSSQLLRASVNLHEYEYIPST
jgi:hypothetical protein